MNILVLSGRLVKDFDYKNEIAKSSIAVDTFKGETMFVDITAFKKTADYCIKYIRKGDLVVVEGELNIYKKDTKVYVSCSVYSIQGFGGGKRKAKDEKTDDVEINDEPQENNADVVDVSDDDLPF